MPKKANPASYLTVHEILNPKRKPKDTAYIWARETLGGQIDTKNIAAMLYDGWRFVPAKRHRKVPKIAGPTPHAPDAVRWPGGMVLMERPQALQDAYRARLAEANAQAAAQALVRAIVTTDPAKFDRMRAGPKSKVKRIVKFRPCRDGAAVKKDEPGAKLTKRELAVAKALDISPERYAASKRALRGAKP